VTADGRFQVGPSQDHRPDLPQGNVLVSALDPLGMPVAPAGVSGQRADAPRDVPAMTRGRESLGRREGLDVGAGPMGALETRAALQAGGDCSLGPLSEIQLPPAIRARDLAPTWRGDHPVPPLHRSPQGGRPALIAEGCEPLKRLLAVVAGAQVCWTERRLGSRSTQLAQAGERRRRARLANAQAAVAALNERRRGQRRPRQLPALQAAVDAILVWSQGQGRLPVRDAEHLGARPLRR
jgi:hypothetical protein